MAEITKIGAVPTIPWATYNTGAGNIVGGPSRSQLMEGPSDRVGSGFIAGEALGPFDACFIFAGYVFRSEADNATHAYGAPYGTATAVQAARVDGFAAGQTQAGEAVTLWGSGVEANYTTVASSGAVALDLFLSATVPGGLATTAATVSSVVQSPVAFYLGDGRIRIQKK